MRSIPRPTGTISALPRRTSIMHNRCARSTGWPRYSSSTMPSCGSDMSRARPPGANTRRSATNRDEIMNCHDYWRHGWRRHIGRCLLRAGAAVGSLLVALFAVSAQDYPSRAVRVIVPYPAGGTADAMPRLIGDWLTRKWGHPVVIENRTGAGGNIGAETAFKAEPDGYTLMATPPAPLVINQNLYPKLGYDPLGFEPIVVVIRVPNALVVNPRLPAKNVPEFIEYARANPGKITSATQGIGTTSHLTSELFSLIAQVKFQNVPYRGSAPALTDLVSSNVDIMFDNLGVSLALVKGGQLRLLGVATRQRMAALPDVPAIAEFLPGF